MKLSCEKEVRGMKTVTVKYKCNQPSYGPILPVPDVHLYITMNDYVNRISAYLTGDLSACHNH